MKRLIVLGFALFLFTGLVIAAPLNFTDGFDEAELGKAPAGWELLGDDKATAIVVDKAAVEPHTIPHCVKLVDNSPAASANIIKQLGGDRPKATVKYAVFVPAGGADFYVLVYNGEDKALEVGVSAGGNVRYRDSGNQNINVAKAAPNAWHTYELSWDVATGMISYTLDGKKLGDYPFFKKIAPNRIVFKAGSTDKVGWHTYLDSIEIKAD